MGKTSPQNPVAGQRALAAIVFTDVVGFSARMQTNEMRTLRLVQRDFEVIQDLATQNGGTVLKSTGDGQLLHFTSAVHAVACALAMQRHFAEQAKQLPPKEVLVHRVGIHLGDVFVTEKDVMGDGVNIAARLQAEAEPGGICISQTVYDVVKSKLALQVTSLGPRDLKNITESIPVYKLLLEAQILETTTPFSVQPRPGTIHPLVAGIPPRRGGWQRLRESLGGRGLHVAGGAALLLLGAVFLAVTLPGRLAERRHQREVEAAQQAVAAIFTDSQATDQQDAAEFESAASELSSSLPQWRRQYLRVYNFQGLAQLLEKQTETGADSPGTRALLRSVSHLAVMKEWLIGELQQYSAAAPLTVRELSGSAPRTISVFGGTDRRLYLVEKGAVRGVAWADVKSETAAAVLAGALRRAATPPTREVVQGVLAFARLYALPELADALRRGRFRPGAGK